MSEIYPSMSWLVPLKDTFSHLFQASKPNFPCEEWRFWWSLWLHFSYEWPSEIIFNIKIILEDLARLLTLDRPYKLRIAWTSSIYNWSLQCAKPVGAWVWHCGPSIWIVGCLCASVIEVLHPCSLHRVAAIPRKIYRQEFQPHFPYQHCFHGSWIWRIALRTSSPVALSETVGKVTFLNLHAACILVGN